MIDNVARGVDAFTSNVFLVTGERTVLVDAGEHFDVVSRVREAVGDGLDAVLVTHSHHDHVGNVDALREALDVETWGFDPDHEAVDNGIADGERVRVGDDDYRALHTPGHRDDHLCFVSASSGVCFAGDLVFANGGFGRTDLDQGDRPALVRSIDRLRETVGDDLRELHAGHGPSVTNDPLETVDVAARAARTR